jgi:hypothetical protein
VALFLDEGIVTASIWCAGCGTEHPLGARCPAIATSGPEQPVWRVSVETPRGLQGCGVLVASTGSRFRARILTYPNVLWTVPGGGSSIKFLARTPEEAERKAIAFLREHCGRRGYVLNDELEVVAEVQRKTSTASHDIGEHARRHMRRLPVRFGVSRPILMAQTGNLSETGLFIVTPRPLSDGELAGLILELEHCKVPLRGSVIWQRQRQEAGRDPGMGLSLLNPPRVYVRYVQALG